MSKLNYIDLVVVVFFLCLSISISPGYFRFFEIACLYLDSTLLSCLVRILCFIFVVIVAAVGIVWPCLSYLSYNIVNIYFDLYFIFNLCYFSCISFVILSRNLPLSLVRLFVLVCNLVLHLARCSTLFPSIINN